MMKITSRGICGLADGKHVTTELNSEMTEQNYWQTDYSFNIDLSLSDFDQYLIFLEMAAEKIWSLTSDRKLVEVHSKFITPFVVGRFFLVKNQLGLFKFDLPWAMQLQITKLQGRVEVQASLRNKSGCGFTIWGADKITATKRRYVLNIFQTRLSSLGECVWLEPYPHGARAVICLTDHPDFDTSEKLELLAERFIRHDFKITKSIFPHSDPRQNKNEPGLDNPEYRKIIEKLLTHGNEIAYHGFSPRVKAPPLDECQRRAESMKSFRATTWIDHGSGSYLLSRKEILAGSIKLTDFLNQYGIKNYWSYMDLWDNPFNDLSCESSHGNIEILKDLRHSFPLLKSMSPLKIAYVFSHSRKNLFNNKSMWYKKPQLFYGRDGTCPTLNLDEIWIFDTVLLNHLGFQLQPSLIDRLCRKAGILIAHCYFCAQQPYMTENCFKTKANKLMFNANFVTAVEYIADRQREKEIITLPFHHLREVLSGFFTSKLIRKDDGWHVQRAFSGRTIIGGSKAMILSSQSDEFEQWLKGDVGYLSLPDKNAVDIKFAAMACA
jgi:hypothetical protein